MPEKILTVVRVGSTAVYELVQTQKRPSVVLRSADHSGERITIVSSAIPTLVQALREIHEVLVPSSPAREGYARTQEVHGTT
jgi:predicted membrane channel-forming protein YqfA (hemolysin III family)